MPSPHASPTSRPVALVAALGVSVALVDVLAALLLRPERLANVPAFSVTLAASTLIGLPLAGLAVLAAQWPRSWPRPACRLGTASALLAVIALGRLSGLLPPSGLSPAAALRLSALVLVSAGLGLATAAALRPAPESAARWLARACGAVPTLLAVGVGGLWFRTYAGAGVGPLGGRAVDATTAAAILAVLALATRAPHRLGWAGPVLAGMALAAPIAQRPRPAAEPEGTWPGRVRHVLLISVDTLRADAIRLDQPETVGGELGRLARQAIVFRDARAPAPWTLPSVVSLLTGLSPDVHEARTARSRLPEGAHTLAERLAGAGYATAAFGDNGVLALGERRLSSGFDRFDFYPRLQADGSAGTLLVERVFPDRLRRRTEAVALSGRALEWMSRHADRPWFVWVHYFDPHLPYAPTPEDLGDRRPPRGLSRRFDDLDGVRAGYLAPDAAQREWIRSLYDAEVAHVSTGLEALLAGVARLGMLDDTLVVLTSDHGEEFWEHDGFEHGHTLFDEVLRVPLAVRLPGAGSARVVDGPVSIESVTPTVLDVCGVRFEPERMSAPSLRASWEADGVAPGPLVAGSTLYYGPRRAVVFDGLKYVRDERWGTESLFDLGSDPGEAHSLADRQPEAVERARDLIEQHDRRARRLRETLGIGEAEQVALTPEVERHLRALGYLQ